MKPLTGKVIYHKDRSCLFIPNDILELEDYYISYNNVDTAIYGSDTTALVKTYKDNPISFLILNGCHMKEYSKLKSYEECLQYYNEHIDQKNKFSDEKESEEE